jgi:hypothetical protein
MTGKKKAAKPVNLHVMLMWAKMIDGASHHVVAIAQGQKWVVGNATTINSDITNKPLFLSPVVPERAVLQ